jgi:putative transposase
MPRRPRSAAPETFFHVLNRSARRTALFSRPLEYRDFLGLLHDGLERHPVRLLAYCIMPNHWHLIVGPVNPLHLSKLLHWVTATHARRLHLRRKTVGLGPIYQGRFKSQVIQAADELVRACRYVERNALRARLVRRAQDWPWCSLSARLAAEERLPLVRTPFLESSAWVGYVNATLTPQERLAHEACLLRPVPESVETVEIRPVPLRDVADEPGVGKGGQKRRGVGGRRHDQQADAHVQGAKHLGVVDAPGALEPREQRRYRPALAVE